MPWLRNAHTATAAYWDMVSNKVGKYFAALTARITPAQQGIEIARSWGVRDSKTEARTVPFICAKNGPRNRQTLKPGNVYQPLGCRNASTRSPVLQRKEFRDTRRSYGISIKSCLACLAASRSASLPLKRQKMPGWMRNSQKVEVIRPPRMTVATG